MVIKIFFLHVKLPNVATRQMVWVFHVLGNQTNIWLYDFKESKVDFFLIFYVFQLPEKVSSSFFMIVKFMRLFLCADITGIFPAMVERPERGGPKYSQAVSQLWSAGVNVMWSIITCMQY